MALKPGALVVADACETGQISPGEAAEEYLGFPAAFLTAGASAVIASFWAVSDFSTALLMEQAYRRLKAGAPPAQALQQASRWLRLLRREEAIALLKDKRAGMEERSRRTQSGGANASGSGAKGADLRPVDLARPHHQGPGRRTANPLRHALLLGRLRRPRRRLHGAASRKRAKPQAYTPKAHTRFTEILGLPV